MLVQRIAYKCSSLVSVADTGSLSEVKPVLIRVMNPPYPVRSQSTRPSWTAFVGLRAKILPLDVLSLPPTQRTPLSRHVCFYALVPIPATSWDLEMGLAGCLSCAAHQRIPTARADAHRRPGPSRALLLARVSGLPVTA